MAVSSLFIVASVLTLIRFRFARPAYIGALIATGLLSQQLANQFASDMNIGFLTVSSNILLAALVSAYLYFSKTVRTYFCETTTHTS